MADLRGGSTVNGYTILHSGLSSSILMGTLSLGTTTYLGASPTSTYKGSGITIGSDASNAAGEASIQLGTGSDTNFHIVRNMSGSGAGLRFYSGNYGSGSLMLTMQSGGILTLPGNGEIRSGYNSNYIIKDHNNGAVTLSGAGGALYIGYQNTSLIQQCVSITAEGTFNLAGASQLVGDYVTNTTNNKMIWTIGNSWNTWASHYGLAYEYGTINGVSDHQLTIREGGTTHIRFGMGGSITMDGTLTINKSGNWSQITFPAQANDPGYIGHYESSNTAEMRFCASDDRDANDSFAWGSTPSGSWSCCTRLYTNGDLHTDGGLWCSALGAGHGNEIWSRSGNALYINYRDSGEGTSTGATTYICDGKTNPCLTISAGRYAQMNFNATSGAYWIFDCAAAGGSGTEATMRTQTSQFGWVGYSSDVLWRVYANSCVSTSDRELKENIVPFNIYDGYDMFKQLKLYSYSYKDKPTHDLRLGTMAQDVPYLVGDIHDLNVNQEQFTGIDLYAYTSLTASAVQVLQEKVETLESRLEKLEAIITQLTQQ